LPRIQEHLWFVDILLDVFSIFKNRKQNTLACLGVLFFF
jgi:hypothetical protein